MHSKVLWALDTEIDPARFERLCTDLLNREGYSEIVPIGGVHDRGRDAEIKQRKRAGGATFFQYSLEERWESKLKKELKKVRENGHEIDFYIFVTSQRVTGDKRDKLERSIFEEYGWRFIVYDREWLRLCLEEKYLDLSAKYLGIQETLAFPITLDPQKPMPSQSGLNQVAWQLYALGKYEAAALALKELLRTNDTDKTAWQALAWSQYSLFRYEEALDSVERALVLDKSDEQSLSLKASILTEDGIRKGIRANLVLARNMFKQICETSSHWVNHYNFGNALHALGSFEAARDQFLLAIELDPKQAMVWKNLGTVYFHLKDHTEELRCYDKALEIDSQLTEALASKGVTLLVIFHEQQQAIDLINRALEADKNLPRQWPKARYWLSQAYFELEDYEQALQQIEASLAYIPSHQGFLDLKAQILVKLWRTNVVYQDEALAFFQFRLEVNPDDYNSFVEIVQLYKASKQFELAWLSIADRVGIPQSNFKVLKTLTKHDLEDYLIALRYIEAYRLFRECNSTLEYVGVLAGHQIVLGAIFADAVFLAGMLSFGLATELLIKMPENKRGKSIHKLYNMILDSLGKSLPYLSTQFADTSSLTTIEQKISALSSIVVSASTIALLEFSRQAGYIGGTFGISALALDKAMQVKDKPLAKWQGKIVGGSFLELNKVLQVIPE